MDNSTHLNEAELRNFYNLVKKESEKLTKDLEKVYNSKDSHSHSLGFLEAKLKIYLNVINQ
jgi:flagellar biosynthesis chaperone FliJ